MRKVSAALLVAITGLAVADQPGERFTAPLGLPLIDTGVLAIQERLGPAQVSIAGHHEETVCYLWPDPSSVVFFAVGQEGIDASFTMRQLEGEAPANCSVVPASKAKQIPLNVGGLTLGMTKAAFVKVVGPVKALSNGTVGIELWRKDPLPQSQGNDAEYLDVGIRIEGRFKGDRLTELVVWKSEST